jgi:hypothetical protein
MTAGAAFRDLAGQTETDTDDDAPDDARRYRLLWIPGESKRKFVERALAEFYRLKNEDLERGGIVASNRINPKHIEWFVRFQVKQEGYDSIARSEKADRTDVRRAIREIASLLELELRPTAAGRPRGRGKPKRQANLIVRSRTRR